jgi:membrane protein required for beta-lactamase induction
MAARPGVRHLLLVLPLIAVAVWVGWRARSVRDDPAAVLRALRAAPAPVLPDAGAVGAAGRTAPESYDRESLYQFIDGAAEAYLTRGFEVCVAVTYSFAVAGAPLEVAAEVYRFSGGDGARGQRDQERPLAAAAVPGAADAASDGTVLLAVRGRDLLKLTALGTDPSNGAILARIATTWELGSGT